MSRYFFQENVCIRTTSYTIGSLNAVGGIDMSVKCPKCMVDTGVTKTWSIGSKAIRTRKCKKCGVTRKTVEHFVDEYEEHVTKEVDRYKAEISSLKTRLRMVSRAVEE